MAKRYFIVSYENEELLEDLSDTQISELFKALFRYAKSGEVIATEDKLLRCAFKIFRKSIDASNKKYDEICKRNAENGAKGGRPKKETEEPDGISETQNNPKNPVGFSETQTNPDEPKKANTNTSTSTNTNTNTKQKQIDNTGDKSPEPPKPEKEVNHKYGEYQHVQLTDKQYQKLIADYGEYWIAQYIQKLDEYIQMKGAKYKDHNLTIRNWLRNANIYPNGGNANGGNCYNYGTTL